MALLTTIPGKRERRGGEGTFPVPQAMWVSGEGRRACREQGGGRLILERSHSILFPCAVDPCAVDVHDGRTEGAAGSQQSLPSGSPEPYSQKSSCLVAGRWGHPPPLYCPVNLSTAGLALIAFVLMPGRGRAGITLTCVSWWGWQSWAQYPCVAPAAMRISLSVPGSRRGFFFSVSLSLSYSGVSACGILVPQPGIEPGPPAVEVRKPNHWTARGVPRRGLFSGCFTSLGPVGICREGPVFNISRPSQTAAFVKYNSHDTGEKKKCEK